MSAAEILDVWPAVVAHLPLRLRALVADTCLYAAPGGTALTVAVPWRLRTYHCRELLLRRAELQARLGVDVVVVLLPEDAEPEPRRASFGRWLRRQRYRDDAVGDLARDVRRDRCWPGRTLRTMRDHLLDHGACDGALDALDAAWLEWATPQLVPVRGSE